MVLPSNRACILVLLTLATGPQVDGQLPHLDESWTVTVNGQTVQVNPDGSFQIPNIAALDSTDDGVSDDFYRLVARSATSAHGTRYFVTDSVSLFQLANDTLTLIPPQSLVSVEALDIPDQLVLSGADSVIHLEDAEPRLQLTALAEYSQSGSTDVTASQWVLYRSSNEAIATVSVDGLVTGVMPGTVVIMASLEGVAATKVITIQQAEVSTTIEGYVFDASGQPIIGATVNVQEPPLATVSDAAGFFEFVDVAIGATEPFVTLSASTIKGGTGMAPGVEVMANGLTDAGIITVLTPIEHPLFPGQRFKVADDTRSMAVGYFDNDGAEDIVVASRDSLEVLWGQGDGTFVDGVVEPIAGVASLVSTVVVADFDGDSFDDIVVDSDLNIVVMLSNGDGTFSRSDYVVSTSNALVDCDVADVQGDGYPDIVTLSKWDQKLYVLLYDPQGGPGQEFVLQAPVDLSSTFDMLAVGNLDSDPFGDAVVGNTSGFEVLRNTGSGIPGVGQWYAEPLSNGDFAVGDVDGDGDADVVAGANGMTIYSSDGSASLVVERGHADIQTGVFPVESIRVVKDNGLGDESIVVAGASQCAVLEQSGGGWEAVQLVQSGATSKSAALIQGHTSGLKSLAVASASTGWVGVFERPDVFTTASYVSLGGVERIDAALFDADSFGDIVVAGAAQYHILLNNGLGGLGPPQSFFAAGYINGLAAEELNGDGLPDVAVLAHADHDPNDRIIVHWNDLLAPGQFDQLSMIDLEMTEPLALAVGEFNCTAQLDIAVVGRIEDKAQWQRVERFYNVAGSFSPENADPTLLAGLPSDYKADVAVVNLDGGAEDLLMVTTDVLSFVDNASCLLSEATALSTWDPTVVIAAGDLDADGEPDVAVAETANITVAYGDGAGWFDDVNAVQYGTDSAFSDIRRLLFGDVNGDSLDDIVSVNYGTDTVSILIQATGGGFQDAGHYYCGTDPTDAALLDVENDGDLDLVVVHQDGIAVLRNKRF